MHVKQDMVCEVMKEYTRITADYEILCVKIENSLYAVLYRPPSSNFTAFSQFLDELLDYSSIRRYNMLLGGDFNMNMLDDNIYSRELSSKITPCGFKNIITTPTSVTLTG